VSTDAWPTIEYETPKDILDNFAYFQNRATLVRFRSPRPFPFRGDPTTEEARLADSAFSHGWRDPRALARLSAAWSAEGSRSTGRWLLDELSPDEAAASGYEADPSVDLGRHGAQLTRFLSTLAEPRCEPSPAFADKEAVPLTVERASGTNASRSGPQAALDTFVAPEWSQGGWLVRGAGRPPTLDLRLDHPRRVGSVHVAVDGVDGNVVRTRVFGLDERGRWWPLASGSQLSDLRCRGTRVYPLGADVPALVVLRLETQGEALSNRIAVHEVWALERKGHE